jgi:hypothetical protein
MLTKQEAAAIPRDRAVTAFTGGVTEDRGSMIVKFVLASSQSEVFEISAAHCMQMMRMLDDEKVRAAQARARQALRPEEANPAPTLTEDDLNGLSPDTATSGLECAFFEDIAVFQFERRNGSRSRIVMRAAMLTLFRQALRPAIQKMRPRLLPTRDRC